MFHANRVSGWLVKKKCSWRLFIFERIVLNYSTKSQMNFLSPVYGHQSICQYNEDCPPNKLCDRLNRRCINPCTVDSCGDNAECTPVNHGIECACRNGFIGNAYIECTRLQGCRSDSECASSEACVNGQCGSPCQCGISALCEVVNHRPICKCPNGYSGDPRIGCNPPLNACEPNPCGLNAMCELDRGNPICFCPKGLTGNPFKNCSTYFTLNILDISIKLFIF